MLKSMSGDKKFSCNSFAISVYQIYNFSNFSTQKQVLKVSWICLCRHGLHSTPPIFWAKLQVSGTLKCVTSFTLLYKFLTQVMYKLQSWYSVKLPGNKRGYMIYTRFYIFQIFLVHIAFCILMCFFIKQYYCIFLLFKFNIMNALDYQWPSYISRSLLETH